MRPQQYAALLPRWFSRMFPQTPSTVLARRVTRTTPLKKQLDSQCRRQLSTQFILAENPLFRNVEFRDVGRTTAVHHLTLLCVCVTDLCRCMTLTHHSTPVFLGTSCVLLQNDTRTIECFRISTENVRKVISMSSIPQRSRHESCACALTLSKRP